MKNKDLYEWTEESFEDRVKREMSLPVWERPSLMRDYLYDAHRGVPC